MVNVDSDFSHGICKKTHPIMSGSPVTHTCGNRLFEISSAVTEGRRSTALGGAGRNNFPSFGVGIRKNRTNLTFDERLTSIKDYLRKWNINKWYTILWLPSLGIFYDCWLFVVSRCHSTDLGGTCWIYVLDKQLGWNHSNFGRLSESCECLKISRWNEKWNRFSYTRCIKIH